MRILRAGLFERVSTEEQAKYGYSIRNQVESLEEYCEKNNIKVVDHYTDEGVSGGKPYTKRPEMKRLLEDVQAGKIDIILFTRLDRWFRNVKEYFKVQEILDDHKVEWKAIWEDYDTTTSNGRMAITIFLAIAQAERERGAERIRAVFESKRKNKESFFGKNSIPFGYTEEPDEDGITRLVKDPELESVLNDFWEIAVKYQNIAKAAKYVNLTYGVNRSKKLWYELSHKEIYTGVYRGVKDYCPAYVSYDDWYMLQNRNIKATKNNRIYLFTGLVKCPVCGYSLKATYTIQKHKNGTKEYKRYRCDNRAVKMCNNKHGIYESKTERWLLENIEQLIKDEIARVEIARTKPKKKPKNANLIPSLKEQLRRLDVMYMAGNKTDEEYLSEQKEIKAAIKKAESENPNDPGEKDITILKKTLEKNFLGLYKDLDREDKRRFWRTLLKEIHVEGTNVVSVEFN